MSAQDSYYNQFYPVRLYFHKISHSKTVIKDPPIIRDTRVMDKDYRICI